MSIDLPSSDSFDVQTNDNNNEIINNPERGCGYLKEDKTYIRSDVSPGGELPAFVTFDDYIPYKEGLKRSWTRFPGMQFELTVTEVGSSEVGMTDTTPGGEVHQHIHRLEKDSPEGQHAGAMPSFHANDMIMSVGGTYYNQPSDFITECRQHGLSKGINTAKNTEPPRINPGRTRLFIIHPNAIKHEPDEDAIEEARENDEDLPEPTFSPGIIGYTYLTRAVHTEDSDGHVPDYIDKMDSQGLLDVVDIGERVPEEQQMHNTSMEEWKSLEEQDESMAEDVEENSEMYEALADDEEETRERGEESYPLAQQQDPDVLGPRLVGDDYEKAPLGDLADECEAMDYGWIFAGNPEEENDVLNDGSIIGVVDLYGAVQAIVASNNASTLHEDQLGDADSGVTSVVGPYRVSMRNYESENAGREIRVFKNR